jgi:8-oxo-dGTP diphosphatase
VKVVPHLILRNEEKIFLSRRASTQKFYPNLWHCVCGTVEEGESPLEAIIREAQEEIGIHLQQPPKLVTTIYLKEPSFINSPEPFYALELFFLADLPKNQTPHNQEPHKQDAIDWFCITKLPKPIVPVIELGIECFLAGEVYRELRL